MAFPSTPASKDHLLETPFYAYSEQALISSRFLRQALSTNRMSQHGSAFYIIRSK